MLLNALRALSPVALKPLVDVPALRFEFAMLDGIGGVGRAVEAVSAGRILFGSHAPFYYFESALLKVKEAGLPEAVADRICQGNARDLLRR